MLHRTLALAPLLLVAVGAPGSRPPAAPAPPPPVEIRSEVGKVLVAADQIRSYDWATHTLTLVPEARSALVKTLPTSRLVSGVPFTVTVGGKPIYRGNFTSLLSSRSLATPVIVIDLPVVEPELKPDRLQIQLGYPGANLFQGADPRSDPRLRDALKASGKLANP